MQYLKLGFLAVALHHDDAMPWTALISVLALSLIERTPESIGEDTVKSIKEEGVASVEPDSMTEVESKTREAAEFGAMSVADSGVDVCAMSVTGRIVGGSTEVLTVCMSGEVKVSAKGTWPESVGGGNVGEGEIASELEGDKG